jgi:hypothetical protein
MPTPIAVMWSGVERASVGSSAMLSDTSPAPPAPAPRAIVQMASCGLRLRCVKRDASAGALRSARTTVSAPMRA